MTGTKWIIEHTRRALIEGEWLGLRALLNSDGSLFALEAGDHERREELRDEDRREYRRECAEARNARGQDELDRAYHGMGEV